MRMAPALTALLLFIASMTWAGCGEMSKQDYVNKAWEVHEAAGEKLTILFQEFGQETEAAGVKESALRSIQLAERMQQIFSESLRRMEALKPPGELAGLHEELLGFYNEGLSLGEDLVDAFDQLYEISTILETFINEGLSILEVDIIGATPEQLVAAIDQDVATIRGLSQDIGSYAGGDAAAGLIEYLKGLFDQLTELMTAYRPGIQSGQQGAREEFSIRMTEILEGFGQTMQGGLPGLKELLERRDMLRDEYFELGDRINEI